MHHLRSVRSGAGTTLAVPAARTGKLSNCEKLGRVLHQTAPSYCHPLAVGRHIRSTMCLTFDSLRRMRFNHVKRIRVVEVTHVGKRSALQNGHAEGTNRGRGPRRWAETAFIAAREKVPL